MSAKDSLPTVTVLNFQNRNPGDGYDWLQKAFPDMLLTHFVQHGKFAALEREKMQTLFDELKLRTKAAVGQDAATEFARVAKVRKVVYGHYAVENGKLAVTAFILDAETQRVASIATVSGPLQDLCELERGLFARLVERLGRPLTEAERAQLKCVISGNLSATTHFYHGLAAFDDGDYPRALVEFRTAVEQDTSYGESRLWAAKIYRSLGEFEHAIVELRTFTRSLPQHPVALEAHRLAGLILLQDLKKPQLAVAEFEKLAGSEPEASHSPSRLREAHWKEYVLHAKKKRPPFWYTQEEQAADQTEFERLQKVAVERTRRFKLCVEGWYRIGECWEQLSERRKAFEAYDQARAISRWMLLDVTDAHVIYYATYRAYERLLAAAEMDVPIPDWVLRVDEKPIQLLGHDNRDLCYRYSWRPSWPPGEFTLLAPPGLQLTNITAHLHSGATALPAQYRLCIWNFQTADGWTPPYDYFRDPIYCFPYYLDYTWTTNAFTQSFPISGNQCATVLRVLDFGGQVDSLLVECNFSPLEQSQQASRKAAQPTQDKATCQVHYLPADADLYVDDTIASPSEAGYCPLAVESGRHRFELRKDGWQPISLEVDLPPKSERSLFLSLDSAWKDLGVRLPGCNRPHLSQAPNGEFWLVYDVAADLAPQGKTHDLWTTRSRDLVQWNEPRPLSINSRRDEISPKLIHRGDGSLVLAFLSDRKQEESQALYVAASRDGRSWSTPRMIADVGANAAFSLVSDSEDRIWLLYPDRGKHALRSSAEGLIWDEVRAVDLEKLPFPIPPKTWQVQSAFLTTDPTEQLMLLTVASYSNETAVTRFESDDGIGWRWRGETRYADLLFSDGLRRNIDSWVRSAGTDWPRACLTARGDYLTLTTCYDTLYAGLIRANGKVEPPHTLWHGSFAHLAQCSPPIRSRDGRYIVCRALPSWLHTNDYGISDGTRILVCAEGDMERNFSKRCFPWKTFWMELDQFAFFDHKLWSGSSRHPSGLRFADLSTRSDLQKSLHHELSGARITAMRTDRDRLWIGAADRGLFVRQLGSETIEEFPWPRDGKHPTITTVETDTESVSVGTVDDGLHVYTKRTGLWERHAPEREIGSITTLALARGKVWVGTSSGLWKLDLESKRWTCLLDNRSVQSLALLGDRLWIGGGHGLFVHDLQHGGFQTILPARIQALVADECSLWIATGSHGLHRMDLETRDLRYVPLDMLGYGERPRVDRLKLLVDDGDYLFVSTDHLTEFVREILRVRKADALAHAIPSKLKVSP